MAINLDGTTQWLRLGSAGAATDVYHTVPWTIAALINLDDFPYNSVCIYSQDMYVSWGFWIHPSGYLTFTTGGGTSYSYPGVTLSANGWFTVMGVVRSLRSDFYAYQHNTRTLTTNRDQYYGGGYTPSAPTAGRESRIGSLYDDTMLYPGQIGWVGIWGEDLGQAGAANPAAFHQLTIDPWPLLSSASTKFFGTTLRSLAQDFGPSGYAIANVGGAGFVGGGPTELPAPGAIVVTTDTSGSVLSITPSGAIIPTGALRRDDAKRLTGAITPTGLVRKDSQKTALAGTITPTGLVRKTDAKTILGGITPSGILQRAPSRRLLGALTPTGALVRAVSKRILGAITPTGLVRRDTGKRLTGGLTPTGTFTSVRAYAIAIAGALTPAGILRRDTSKRATGTLTPVGTLARATSRQLTGAITPTGLVRKLLATRLLGGLTPTGALTLLKAVARTFTGAITPAGTLVRAPSKRLTGTLTPVGALVRATSKRLLGALTPTSTLTVPPPGLTLSGTITPTGALRRATGKTLRGTLTPAGLLAIPRTYFLTLTGALVPAGGISLVYIAGSGGVTWVAAPGIDPIVGGPVIWTAV